MMKDSDRALKIRGYLAIIVGTLVDACWYSKNEEIRPAPMVQAIRDYLVFLEEESAAIKVECSRLRIEIADLRREKENAVVAVIMQRAEHEDPYLDDERKPQK